MVTTLLEWAERLVYVISVQEDGHKGILKEQIIVPLFAVLKKN
jgi:hypothetical protein